MTIRIKYQFEWCPKFRRPVLEPEVAERLDELICHKAQEIGGEILNLTIQLAYPDMFCSFPPTIAPSQIMHRIKGYTAHSLRSEIPWLKSGLPNVWTRSYFVGTAGNVSAATIQRYIEEQARS